MPAGLVAGEGLEEQPWTLPLRALREAAQQGDRDAQYRLGIALSREYQDQGSMGAGTEAARWLTEAATQGHGRAQLELGVMYEKGQGVIQDYSEACRWLQKAAEQGEPVAMYRLGQMAEIGRGVQKDAMEAYVWFNLAVARGEAAVEPARDRARSLLSEEQVAEAQKRSRLLDAQIPGL
ncbi:MAG: tetratricopeptide repeat protein [Deferrisomatales bacterium]|nr:tetratricopeptide repeat protein [Deferrisomatales bacterium]